LGIFAKKFHAKIYSSLLFLKLSFLGKRRPCQQNLIHFCGAYFDDINFLQIKNICFCKNFAKTRAKIFLFSEIFGENLCKVEENSRGSRKIKFALFEKPIIFAKMELFR
jgi:hypothetical protein